MWECIQTLKNVSHNAVIFKMTLPQYDCIASLTAVKMSATFKNNYFLEKVEAIVEVFSLCGFL
jgi:hypothetical protein